MPSTRKPVFGCDLCIRQLAHTHTPEERPVNDVAAKKGLEAIGRIFFTGYRGRWYTLKRRARPV
jgi:hypothetical protein